jgi:hypothetical protein
MLPTFEGRPHDQLFKVSFLALYGAVVFSFAHFLHLSQRLLSALRQMARLPMAAAYDRLAMKVAGSFGLRFLSRMPDVAELAVSVQVSRTLATLAASAGGSIAASSARLARVADITQRAMHEIDADPGPACPAWRERRGHAAFFRASRLVYAILTRVWQERARSVAATEMCKEGAGVRDLQPGGPRQNVPTILALWGAASPCPSYLWTRTAEDFVAARVTTLVHQVLGRLRDLMVFAMAGGLLLVAAVVAYPFHPPRFFSVFSWAMVLVVVAGGLVVIMRLERNEIMSRLAGTSPGRINLRMNLISQLVLYVVLPVGALAATLLPEVSDVLFGWLEPLRRALP